MKTTRYEDGERMPENWNELDTVINNFNVVGFVCLRSNNEPYLDHNHYHCYGMLPINAIGVLTFDGVDFRIEPIEELRQAFKDAGLDPNSPYNYAKVGKLYDYDERTKEHGVPDLQPTITL